MSAAIYYVQYLLFHQTHDTIFYLLQDLAFVPIQVVMVTMIINRFLNVMEKRKKIKKINVIISTFFVEAGISIIETISKFNRNNDEFCKLVKVSQLNRKNVSRIKKAAKEFKFDIYADPSRLDKLYQVLAKYKSFTLNMLENSNLLEHDSFTDMLWAVFHVADELQTRGDFVRLDKDDIDHLSNDMLRAYSAMVVEWINYMGYLHDEYPFLYALAIKKNPFVTAQN
ncbi:MAG: hypothetical protein AAGU76_07295 [Sedimentibacter sp.]|uniref:hypothetical protein n=1 Tax=Sedimentibacter sp. TaxID=1960295 RepID=UPI0031595CDE